MIRSWLSWSGHSSHVIWSWLSSDQVMMVMFRSYFSWSSHDCHGSGHGGQNQVMVVGMRSWLSRSGHGGHHQVMLVMSRLCFSKSVHDQVMVVMAVMAVLVVMWESRSGFHQGSQRPITKRPINKRSISKRPISKRPITKQWWDVKWWDVLYVNPRPYDDHCSNGDHYNPISNYNIVLIIVSL